MRWSATPSGTIGRDDMQSISWASIDVEERQLDRFGIEPDVFFRQLKNISENSGEPLEQAKFETMNKQKIPLSDIAFVRKTAQKPVFNPPLLSVTFAIRCPINETTKKRISASLREMPSLVIACR